MPRSTTTETVAGSGRTPAARDPRRWRLTGGGAVAGVVLLLLGMFGVFAGAEYLDGKRGGEIAGSLALAAPVILIVTVVLAAVLHLCLRRVRSRNVYIAGVGVGAALGWILVGMVILPAMVSGEATPGFILLGAALAVVWAVAAAVATRPLRPTVAGTSA